MSRRKTVVTIVTLIAALLLLTATSPAALADPDQPGAGGFIDTADNNDKGANQFYPLNIEDPTTTNDEGPSLYPGGPIDPL